MSIWHSSVIIMVIAFVKPVLKDHCYETTCLKRPVWQKILYFNVIQPVTKDHLSWETTFVWPMGWSFKTSSTGTDIFLLFIITEPKFWIPSPPPHQSWGNLPQEQISFCPCNRSEGSTNLMSLKYLGSEHGENRADSPQSRQTLRDQL